MNTSPSMMDFGVYQLRQFLQSRFKDKWSNTWANFHWDENVIIIRHVPKIYKATEDEVEAKANCGDFIHDIREEALVNTDTGKAYGDYSYFAELFSHVGYTQEYNSKTDKDILADLDKKFKIIYRTLITNEDGKHKLVICKADLLGTSFSTEIEE